MPSGERKHALWSLCSGSCPGCRDNAFSIESGAHQGGVGRAGRHHIARKWTVEIAGRRNTVVLNDSDLTVTIQAGPTAWKMAPSSGDDMVVKSAGELFPLGLGTAGAIEISPYDTGYKSGVNVVLGQFRSNGLLHRGSPIDLTCTFTICLEGQDEELVMEVSANEHEAAVRQLDWPKELDAQDVDHTVLSNAEGTLLPRNWRKRYDPINVGGNDQSFVQSNLIASARGKNRPFPLTKSDPHEEHDLSLGKENDRRYHPRRRRAVCRSILRAAGA